MITRILSSARRVKAAASDMVIGPIIDVAPRVRRPHSALHSNARHYNLIPININVALSD